MSEPDLNSMTVDELDQLNVEYKRAQTDIREKRIRIKEVRERKVLLSSLAQKLNIDVDHLTDEQIKVFLEIAKQTPPREGDVTVTPNTAKMTGLVSSSEVQ